MKRFVFRLASILRLREFEFEQARARWAQLERERSARRAQVEESTERVARAQRRMADDVAAGSLGRELSLRARGLAVGRFLQAQAESRLEEMDEPCETARTQMIEAQVPVRSLERLRDKQAEAHRAAFLREEQALLDEQASLRAARSQREEVGAW